LPASVSVVGCLGNTAGEALNILAAAQTCDAMVVADGVGVVPQLGFFEAVRMGLSSQPGSLFTTFFATDDMTIGMPLGGDVASQTITSRAYGPEMIAMRDHTFGAIGGFEQYDARRGIVHEYVTRASESGHDLLVFPEQLLTWRAAVEESRDFQSDPLYSYLAAKPIIDSSQLVQRKVLLAALRGAGGGPRGVDERLLRGPADDEAETSWLMPATWDPENASAAQHRCLIVGLDAERDEIWLYARGPGERRLKVRGEDEAVEFKLSQGAEGSDDYVTLSTFQVPDYWAPGNSYPLTWGTYDGEEKLRNLFLRVNKVGATTFALWGRNTVLSARALGEVVDRRSKVWQQPPSPAPSPAAPVESPAPKTDPTEEYVSQAVAAARRFVRRRGDLDPLRAVRRSRDLLQDPPTATPLPISPGSGLKPPHDDDGWPAGEWLIGWAWDREDRDRILHVALVRDQEPLIMVAADRVDRSLDNLPGRGQHVFQVPVLREFLDEDRLRLEIWEGRFPVFRGRLYVDREGRPMLRRIRDKPDEAVIATKGTGRKQRWWSRR